MSIPVMADMTQIRPPLPKIYQSTYLASQLVVSSNGLPNDIRRSASYLISSAMKVILISSTGMLDIRQPFAMAWRRVGKHL